MNPEITKANQQETGKQKQVEPSSKTFQSPTNLTNEERVIFELKYKSNPFDLLNDTELLQSIQALLFKIKIVTGWPLPEIAEERKILYEQLSLHLRESWGTLNADEVMFAMREHGTTIKNWGKDINLALIDEALNIYYAKRIELSRLEESKANNSKQLEAPKYQADWKELCELRYQDYLSGTYDLTLWPVELYDQFVKSNMMAADTYEDFLNDGKRKVIADLNSKKDSLDPRVHALKIGGIMMELGEVRLFGIAHQKVVAAAKKLAVQFLYSEAKKRGFKNLFSNKTNYG